MPGSISGAIGYRAELAGQRRRILTLGSASVLGGILGAVLLLSLPSEAFEAIVPVLIALALVLVVLQPRLSRALAARRERVRPHGGPLLWTRRVRHRRVRRLLRRGAGRDPARA